MERGRKQIIMLLMEVGIYCGSLRESSDSFEMIFCNFRPLRTVFLLFILYSLPRNGNLVCNLAYQEHYWNSQRSRNVKYIIEFCEMKVFSCFDLSLSLSLSLPPLFSPALNYFSITFDLIMNFITSLQNIVLIWNVIAIHG